MAACPVKGSLEVGWINGKQISPWVFGGMVLGFFVLAIGVAKVTGHWETALTFEDYARLLPLRHLTGLP